MPNVTLNRSVTDSHIPAIAEDSPSSNVLPTLPQSILVNAFGMAVISEPIPLMNVGIFLTIACAKLASRSTAPDIKSGSRSATNPGICAMIDGICWTMFETIGRRFPTTNVLIVSPSA